MPKISVNIITHNRAKYISKAITSVLKQDFKDFELIIVDDASSDNTYEIIKPFLRDKRVKYFLLSKQKNIATLRNFALKKSNSKYIAILDSDDIWCDNLKLKKQFKYLENHSEVVLVGSGAILINEKGKEIGKCIKPIFDKDIKKDFFIKNPVYHSSVMYRYAELKKIGAYDEKMTYCDDMDLWLRFGETGKLYNFPDTFIKYRIHKDNESVKNFKGAIIDVLKFIARNRKKYGMGWSVFFKKIFGKFSEYLRR